MVTAASNVISCPEITPAAFSDAAYESRCTQPRKHCVTAIKTVCSDALFNALNNSGFTDFVGPFPAAYASITTPLISSVIMCSTNLADIPGKSLSTAISFGIFC